MEYILDDEDGVVVRGKLNTLIDWYNESLLLFILTSTGDGSGVSTLKMTASEDTILTLEQGTARFYSDAGGTQDESTTWTVTAGAERTRYIKCPSGTANFYIEKDTITSWGQWTSGTNAASLGGDISVLTSLTSMWVLGSNTLSGSVAALTSLTTLSVGGSNTVSGSVAALTSLTYLSVTGSNTLSGDVSALTSLTYITVTGSNTLSGSIAALTSLTWLTVTGSNTLSGSVAALTSLTYLTVLGSNTVSGDVALISAGITLLYIVGQNQIVTYTAGGDWSSIDNDGTVIVSPGVGYGLSSAEVDLFIQEVESTRTAGRAIHITLTGSNAARTAASDAAVTAIENDGGTVTTN